NIAVRTLFSKMKATFGGGCFWCTEVIFQNIEGVGSVLPGYMGGKTDSPTYKEVCNGDTDHVEVVQLDFDEHKVDFDALLKVFFKTHDPTTLNRKGMMLEHSIVLLFSIMMRDRKKLPNVL